MNLLHEMETNLDLFLKDEQILLLGDTLKVTGHLQILFKSIPIPKPFPIQILYILTELYKIPHTHTKPIEIILSAL